ncbi:hypothetical protein A6456_33840 [Paraburkholderia tropica]|nr:hypothetical protein A6456_33840 [Paraburkholderia tropica]
MHGACLVTSNVGTAINANAQFAATGKPGVRALDNPTMSAEPLAAFRATSGATRRDAALSQVTTAVRKVITSVFMQFAGAISWLSVEARRCRNVIKCGLECHRVVP